MDTGFSSSQVEEEDNLREEQNDHKLLGDMLVPDKQYTEKSSSEMEALAYLVMYMLLEQFLWLSLEKEQVSPLPKSCSKSLF